jgi:hypothetical protein
MDKVKATLSSRTFWAAILTSAACFAQTAATGHFDVGTILQCAAPILGWAGLEKLGDAAARSGSTPANRIGSQTNPAL